MPTLSFKAAPAEVRAIRAAARRKRLSVSEYLRGVALPPAPARKKSRHVVAPGRVVIAPAPDAPRLTSDDVAAALYD